eukprot:11363791-Prorocentrum_lima.AAC.1
MIGAQKVYNFATRSTGVCTRGGEEPHRAVVMSGLTRRIASSELGRIFLPPGRIVHRLHFA